MDELLRFALGPVLEPARYGESLDAFSRATRAERSDWKEPFDRGIAGGLRADRLGFAFAGGFASALAALAPRQVSDDAPTALCATEEEGAHPRAIRTTLMPIAAGCFALTGKKKWVTLATEASVLLVVASTGQDARGRNRLRVARVPTTADGVRLSAGPPPPFAPEIPHAEIEFTDVAVAETDLLPGDGYEDYLKPFRTIEDLYVHGALVGYLLGVARRHRFPNPMIERLVALLLASRALAQADPKAPETHIALAGVLGWAASLVDDIERQWSASPDEEWARWERDRPLLRVAGNARAARRDRAWATLST